MAEPIVRQELLLFATHEAESTRIRVGLFSEVLSPPAREFLSNLLTDLTEFYRGTSDHPIRVGAAADVPSRTARRLEQMSIAAALPGRSTQEATMVCRIARLLSRPWRSEEIFVRTVDSTLLQTLYDDVWPISRLVLVLYRDDLSWSGQQLLRSALEEREPPPGPEGVFALLVSFYHGRWLDVVARDCNHTLLMELVQDAARRASYDPRVVDDDAEF